MKPNLTRTYSQKTPLKPSIESNNKQIISAVINWFEAYFADPNLTLMLQYLRIRTIGVGREANADDSKEHKDKTNTVITTLEEIEEKKEDLSHKDKEIKNKNIITFLLNKFLHKDLTETKQEENSNNSIKYNETSTKLTKEKKEENLNYEGLDSRDIAQIFKTVLRESQETIFSHDDSKMKHLRTNAQVINDNQTLSLHEKEEKNIILVNEFLLNIRKGSPDQYCLIEQLFSTSSLFLISPHSRSNAEALIKGFPALMVALGVTTYATLGKEKELWVNIGTALLRHFLQENLNKGEIEKFIKSKDEALIKLFNLDRIEGVVINLKVALGEITAEIDRYLTPDGRTSAKKNGELLRLVTTLLRILSFSSSENEEKFENDYIKDYINKSKCLTEESIKGYLERKYPNKIKSEIRNHLEKLKVNSKKDQNSILSALIENSEIHKRQMVRCTYFPRLSGEDEKNPLEQNVSNEIFEEMKLFVKTVDDEIKSIDLLVKQEQDHILRKYEGKNTPSLQPIHSDKIEIKKASEAIREEKHKTDKSTKGLIASYQNYLNQQVEGRTGLATKSHTLNSLPTKTRAQLERNKP